jgi:alpha-L-fucosidase
MIDYGQRVISFSIEYWNNGRYEKIFSGSTIGRKKIAGFNAVKTDRIRVTIHETKAPVVLRSVSAYHIKSMP